jgi:hypothetical protein
MLSVMVDAVGFLREWETVVSVQPGSGQKG